MNLPASVFRGHLSLCSSLSSYPWCHLHYGPCAEVAYRGRYYRRSTPRILNPYSRSTFLWRRGIECWSSMETGPDNQDDKEKGAEEEMQSSTSIKGEEKEKENGASHSPPTAEQNNVPTPRTEFTSSSGMVDRNSGDDMLQGNNKEKYDPGEVASGSPLPGMKKIGEPIRIPKETIDIFRDQIFGFDTFFVTSQEPYESGVLFKGNLRGNASKSFDKITKRLQDRFGDQYKVFLLINPEDDKPVAVVVPRQIMQPESTAVPELFAAGAFGLVTVFTLLLRNVPALQANLLSVFDNVGLLKDGLSGALVTALILGVHEAGHFLVARDIGVKLGVPYLVPSWQTGSFGAITRILNIVPSRDKLLKLAVAGPLAGFSLGIVLLITGLILPPTDGIGIIIDPAIFHESFLTGGIAKLLLGDVLKEGTQLSINPLVLWAWTGLLINALNSIPAGELDGGRISFALWGRKVSTRISSIALALLGISSLFNDVAFYWVVLIFFLQRGPVAPLAEEITDPDDRNVALGIAVLLLCLLVLLPYPFPFTAPELVVDF